MTITAGDLRPAIFPLPERWPHVETIAFKIADGEEVTAHCHNNGCHHRARLNLVHLAARLGPHNPGMHWDLAPLLVCRPCRAAGRPDRNVGIHNHVCRNPRSFVIYQIIDGSTTITPGETRNC
ncbi:MAG: hypothetical protein ABTQ31_04580 [Rhizobiaceae bacterium]